MFSFNSIYGLFCLRFLSIGSTAVVNPFFLSVENSGLFNFMLRQLEKRVSQNPKLDFVGLSSSFMPKLSPLLVCGI